MENSFEMLKNIYKKNEPGKIDQGNDWNKAISTVGHRVFEHWYF